MQALLVVEAEVAFDARPSFPHRCVIFQVHLLIFERPPQPLDENVVHTASTPIHTDRDFSGLQLAGEFLAGELRALIAVKDLRPSPPQSALQRLDAEVEPIVNDSDQLNTYRLNQSITATK